jgi:hypothetical protein
MPGRLEVTVSNPIFDEDQDDEHSQGEDLFGLDSDEEEPQPLSLVEASRMARPGLRARSRSRVLLRPSEPNELEQRAHRSLSMMEELYEEVGRLEREAREAGEVQKQDALSAHGEGCRALLFDFGSHLDRLSARLEVLATQPESAVPLTFEVVDRRAREWWGNATDAAVELWNEISGARLEHDHPPRGPAAAKSNNAVVLVSNS